MRTDFVRKKIALLLAFVALLLFNLSPRLLAVTLSGDEQARIDEYKEQQSSIKEKIAENQQKLDALKPDIDRQREYVNALQDQISAYQVQIDLYNDNISVLEGQKDEIQKKIDVLDAEIHEIELKINHNQLKQIELQQQIEDIYEELKGRLRDLYKHGRTSTLELLLNSTDFQSFLITMEMSANMAKHDEELISGLNSRIEEIEELNRQHQLLVDDINIKKAEHETEIASLSAKQAEIEVVRDEEKASQAKVEALEVDARAYLSELDQASEEYQAIIARYESDIEAFENKIDAIIAEAASKNMTGDPGTFKPSSGLIWPLQYSDVYISSNYGYRSDPATGASRFHGGVDTCCWSGTYGKAVRAAASGTVIVSTFMAGGYGNYVVIDHGNGLTTVYGHNSSLNVYVGQSVSQGDIIAYAGQTGYATGAHCHFEVRENGTRVNPLSYCSP